MNNIGIDSEINTLVVVFNVDNDDNRQCPVHPLIINYSELVNAFELAFISNCGLMCYLCMFTTFAASIFDRNYF